MFIRIVITIRSVLVFKCVVVFVVHDHLAVAKDVAKVMLIAFSRFLNVTSRAHAYLKLQLVHRRQPGQISTVAIGIVIALEPLSA